MLSQKQDCYPLFCLIKTKPYFVGNTKKLLGTEQDIDQNVQ